MYYHSSSPTTTAMTDLGTLDGRIPASLLLGEAAHQEIDPAVALRVGMQLGAGTARTLARMDITLGQGRTLPESSSASMPSYQKPGNCSWMPPND